MEDFSDSTNRSIVLILFLLYFLYLKYRQMKLKMNKGFSQINCNPLEMVVAGMIDENDASETFEKCTKYSTNEKMQKTVSDNKLQQEEEINNILDELEKNDGITKEQQQEKQKQLFKLLNTKAANVSNLVDQQKLINETMLSTSEPIKKIMTKLSTLTTNLKEIFNKLQD